MEAYYGLVKRLACAFEDFGVEYAFTGALASSFYGVPRTTVDVDVVVAVVSDENVRGKLVSSFRNAGLRVDVRRLEAALKSNYRIVTFMDIKSAFSVDVIFSVGKLKRIGGAVGGVKVFFQCPEDLVLAKLRMIKATVSEERGWKDREDIKAILKFSRVNVEALIRRARSEGTLALFEEITARQKSGCV